MSTLSDKVDNLATHVGQLNTAVTDGVTQIGTVGGNVVAALDQQAAVIADLRAQLANQGVDPATLDKIDQISASADTAKTALTSGLQDVVNKLTDAVNRDVTTT